MIHFLLMWLLLTPLSPSAYQEPSPAIQATSETTQVPKEKASEPQSDVDDEADGVDKENFNTTPTAGAGDGPLTTEQKFSVFGHRMISPIGFAKSAFNTSINQAQNSPEEWGQGVEGFAKRYGNKVANRTVENGIGFLVSVPLRQDPRYFRSGETGIWRRARHAVLYTVLTPTDNGGRTFSAWRFAGNYGAQFVSNAWRPERYTSVSNTLLRGTVSIGYDAASNFFKEIWPDIKRKIFKH